MAHGMTEWQTYGVDADGNVTHAGPQPARRATLATARRLQRRWESWRRGYLREHPGDYPLRADARVRTVRFIMHPLGRPAEALAFTLRK